MVNNIVQTKKQPWSSSLCHSLVRYTNGDLWLWYRYATDLHRCLPGALRSPPPQGLNYRLRLAVDFAGQYWFFILLAFLKYLNRFLMFAYFFGQPTTQSKIPIDITYKRAMQRWCPEFQCPDKKSYSCFILKNMIWKLRLLGRTNRG